MWLTRSRNGQDRLGRRCRPRLEALEDRTVPTVPCLADVAVPDFYTVPSNSVLRADGEGVMTNDMVGSLTGIQPLPGGGSDYGGQSITSVALSPEGLTLAVDAALDR